jgi:hypothetical protein
MHSIQNVIFRHFEQFIEQFKQFKLKLSSYLPLKIINI